MRSLVLAVVWLTLVVYIVLGGVIFHFIEESTESDTKTNAFDGFKNFLSNYSCISHEELELFIKNVIQAYDQGVLVTYNTSSESNWDIASSIFFAITVVTTIGYGHIAPSTDSGRTFFVFYAFVGIPLCMVALGFLGEKLQLPLKKLQKRVLWRDRPRYDSYIKSVIYVTLGFSILILLPALVFWIVEDWSYTDSLYYVVVTLTTVGFGDFVPGANEKNFRAVYKLVVCVWIMIGLAWVALLISEVGDVMRGKVSKLINKHNSNAKELSDKEQNMELQPPSAASI
ncbi:potassium channel subfamily K member 16-like [Gigantopelta aegis]|uniref:potassium channel subfamily K member 16-like n=1 Tax=Gigantopelta aegis TaxID=1735272 RepID=UPI001B88AEF2|nr:potassium channel subfamily K member 16-like [Gigantopelta aegis]XP_041354265.1 potassium channel subfamily K member 16-like [Gigantopelta aegis]